MTKSNGNYKLYLNIKFVLFCCFINFLIQINVFSVPTSLELAEKYDKIIGEIQSFDITFTTTDTLHNVQVFDGQTTVTKSVLSTVNNYRAAVKNDKVRLISTFFVPDKGTYFRDVLIDGDLRTDYTNSNNVPMVNAKKSAQLSLGEQLGICEYFCFPLILPSCLKVSEDHRVEYDLRKNLRLKGVTTEFVDWNGEKNGGILIKHRKTRKFIIDSETLTPLYYEISSKGQIAISAKMQQPVNIIKDSSIGFPSEIIIEYFEKGETNKPSRTRHMIVTDFRINEDVLDKEAFIQQVPKNTAYYNN